jgi:hypothetical protein
MLPQYKTLEQHVQRQIAKRFGLAWPMPDDVHEADLRALMAEKDWLMAVDHDWGIDVAPVTVPKVAMSWHDAKTAFEKRAKELLP